MSGETLTFSEEFIDEQKRGWRDPSILGVPLSDELPHAKTLMNMDNDKICKSNECFCIETDHERESYDSFGTFRKTKKPCQTNEDCITQENKDKENPQIYCDVDNNFDGVKNEQNDDYSIGEYCPECIYVDIFNSRGEKDDDGKFKKEPSTIQRPENGWPKFR